MAGKFKTDWTTMIKKIESDKGGSSFKDERMYTPDKDDKGNAEVVIRFLPSKDTDAPWIKYDSHFFTGVGGVFSEPCPKNIGHKCPACDYTWANWKKGDDENNAPFRKYMSKQQYIMNILIVKDKIHPENNGKVFLFRFGKQIFDKITERHAEQDFVLDWYEGKNFKLVVKTKAKGPNYESSYFSDDATPVGDDEKIESLMEKMYGISEFLDPDKYKDVKTLQLKMDDVRGVESASTDDAPPARTSSNKTESSEKSKTKTKEKAVEEDEDDDDFLLEDEDKAGTDDLFSDVGEDDDGF